jgi:hypothetical protein
MVAWLCCVCGRLVGENALIWHQPGLLDLLRISRSARGFQEMCHTSHAFWYLLPKPACWPCCAFTVGVLEATVPLKQYQKTLLKAKVYRSQAVQLQAQLRKMTAKVARLSKVRRAGFSASWGPGI